MAAAHHVALHRRDNRLFHRPRQHLKLELGAQVIVPLVGSLRQSSIPGSLAEMSLAGAEMRSSACNSTTIVAGSASARVPRCRVSSADRDAVSCVMRLSNLARKPIADFLRS